MAKDQDRAAALYVAVSTVASVPRFCRAGLCFGVEPSVLAVAELGVGVLERLRAEPRLSVSEAAAPAATPAAAASAADKKAAAAKAAKAA